MLYLESIGKYEYCFLQGEQLTLCYGATSTEGFLVKLDANSSVVVAIDKQLTFLIKRILNHTHAVHLVRGIGQ